MVALPFDAHASQFLDLVREHQVVVLEAQTGAGKSTKAPLALLQAGVGGDKLIGVTEPRRPAARNLAKWVAQLHGTPMGQAVGYQIGQDNKARGAQLKYMTEGILLAQMRSDPLLERYGVIVLDEVHERGVNQDLLMALVKGVLPHRPDLKVVVMSATIDAKKFSDYFGGAPVLSVPGRTFPVEVRYLDHTPYSVDGSIDACADKILEILAGREPGDILAFLPDQATIMKVVRKVEAELRGAPVRVLPLFGAQAQEDQEKVFVRDGQRRVIVATNIAETSLTIDGVRHVVDTGLIKAMVYVDASMSALQITEHSRAGCDQRKGRAGRTQDGICHRLYTEQSFRDRDGFTSPEINRMALDQVLLTLRCLGYAFDAITGLDLLDPPTLEKWEQAQARLKLLGAISAEGDVTRDGQRMNRLQVEPMIGRMILEGESHGCLEQVVTIAAALSATRQLFVRPKGKEAEADIAHPQFYVEGSDPLTYLKVWEAWVEKRRDWRWARDNFLSSKALSQTDRVREHLLKILDRQGIGITSSNDSEKIAKAVAAGLIVNLAVSGGRGYSWNDRETFIFPGSALRHQPRFVVCAKVVSTSRAFMRGCHEVKEEWLLELVPEAARQVTYRISTIGRVPVLYAETNWRGTQLMSKSMSTIPQEALPAIAERLVSDMVRVSGRFHPDSAHHGQVWKVIRAVLSLGYIWDMATLREESRSLVESLRTAFEQMLVGVTTMDELMARPLQLNLVDFISAEEAQAHEARLEQERERERAAALERLKQQQSEREERVALRSQVEDLDRRMRDLGEDLSRSSNWEDRWIATDARSAVKDDSWTPIESARQRVSKYAAKVGGIERKSERKFAFTGQIHSAVLDRFPACPVCGGAWGDDFTCRGDHPESRFVPIEGDGEVWTIGEFRTNRGDTVAELIRRGGNIQIQFWVGEGRAWSGRVFKTVDYSPKAGILPPELADEHDEIAQWVAELRQTEQALEASLAQVRRLKEEAANGNVVVLTFKIRRSDSWPVAEHGGVTYKAEFADEWPSNGERWFCQLGKPSTIGRAREASAKLIRKAEGFTTPADVQEIRAMIAESYDGIPSELIN